MHFCKETFSEHFFLLANNCFSVLCEIARRMEDRRKGKACRRKRRSKRNNDEVHFIFILVFSFSSTLSSTQRNKQNLFLEIFLEEYLLRYRRAYKLNFIRYIYARGSAGQCEGEKYDQTKRTKKSHKTTNKNCLK